MTEVTQQPIDVFGLTDSGKVRTSNEDHFVIATLRKAVELRFTSLTESRARGSLREATAQLLVVADGVGGTPGGEYASGLTVQMLLEFITQAAGCFQAFDVDKEQQFLERMEQAVQHSHELIRKEHGPRGHAPSTTLTMVTLIWPRAYLVHAGDSRAYWLQRGRLRPLTQDQTMGEFMVDAGAWTEEVAARAKTAGTLISAVGASELTPTIGLADLERGDSLLLCTDGLTKHVTDERIAAVLGGTGNAEMACRELVNSALEGGGTDNVTAIVARC